MNIPPMVYREAEFISLREKIGPCALHALVAIGTTLQSRRTTRIKIQNPRTLALTCDLYGDIDEKALWDAIVGTWLINQNEDGFEFPFFTDNNSQLLALWENGAKRKRALSNLIELKPTQSNRIETNSTQLNRTELDATSYAMSNARSNAPAVASGLVDSPF